LENNKCDRVTLTCKQWTFSLLGLAALFELLCDYRDIIGTVGNWYIELLYLSSSQGVLTARHVGGKSFRVTGSEAISGCNTIPSDMVISGKRNRCDYVIQGRRQSNWKIHTEHSSPLRGNPNDENTKIAHNVSEW
jgi:hypothetical protein